MPFNLATVANIDKDSTPSKNIVGILVHFEDTNDPAKKHDSLFTPPIAPVADVALAICQWRDQVIAGLNNKAALAAEPALQIGAVVPPAPGPAAPTAKQVWQGKADRLKRLADYKIAATANTGVLNAAFVADLNALAVDVATSYQAGFGTS